MGEGDCIVKGRGVTSFRDARRGERCGGSSTTLRFEIFSFSFLYFSNMVSVIPLSILYVKHFYKHNNQQFNIKAIARKKKKKIPIHPC